MEGADSNEGHLSNSKTHTKGDRAKETLCFTTAGCQYTPPATVGDRGSYVYNEWDTKQGERNDSFESTF